MRIAIVGTDLCAVDERGGGLEQVLRRWASHLAQRHDVTIVSHRPASSRPVGPTPGARTVTVTAPPGGLAEALTLVAPDVVSLHNRPQWAALVPAGATPTVTFHNFPPAWKVGRTRLRLAAETSAVSRALASAAEGRLDRRPGSVAVTPPSIDPRYFAVPDRGAMGPVVLSPHRLLRKKGVYQLLALAGRPAFREVTFAFVDLISPWTRATVEHRELRAAIALVPNAVLWPAASGVDAIARMYAASSVVVCAVREEEGLGLVALEAQASGVPLVTTDLGGLREATFPPNECVPPHDDHALAAAITAALRRTAATDVRPTDVGPTDLGPTDLGPRRRVIAEHSPQAAGDRFEAWLLAAVAAR